jgi:ATP phosphoribosyltransferase
MLTLGLPSKGRLMDQTADWLRARGLDILPSGQAREYAARIDSLPQVRLALLSAGEIPGELAAGRVHLGVTGTDVLRERIADGDALTLTLAPLGFGRADLVIAVPDAWTDVETLDDLDAACARFRAAHGHRLRIATKYHRLTRDFLAAAGVADYALVDSQGATEGTVKNTTAEAIADITTTGETLRANHLRVLSDGLILRSEATLFAATAAPWDLAARATLADLCARLGVAVPAV